MNHAPTPRRSDAGSLDVVGTPRRFAMTDGTVDAPSDPSQPVTMADILRGGEPMGDLSQFAIDDLTEEEEAEFFDIIENC
jgi:hypothetical protein